MEALNEKFEGRLSLAITLFKNEYPRKFLHQLISSQLDMDRLDYLRRDSFYTGVSEGAVNSERLISMLNVKKDSLVVEEKGIYSVEKFIVARRLMYWQVYLHKTGIVAEQLLLRLLKRAKELTVKGVKLEASAELSYVLENPITENNFTSEVLDKFSKLDDYDIISAMKSWVSNDDFVLRTISQMLLERDLLKIKMKNKPFSEEKKEERLKSLMLKHSLSHTEASYFVFDGSISNQAYHMDEDTINLIMKNGKVVDVAKASDQLNLKALSKKVVKYYLCYPKSQH
jgi:HD superfamily phosphohydrolase